MGIENNNAVLATTWSEEDAARMRGWIAALRDDLLGGLPVKSLFAEVEGVCNKKITFILAPDGSKEGWATSDAGDRLRDLFISRLKEDNYSDGSSRWEWIEVGYGEYGQAVLRGNCCNHFSDRPYQIEIGGGR